MDTVKLLCIADVCAASSELLFYSEIIHSVCTEIQRLILKMQSVSPDRTHGRASRLANTQQIIGALIFTGQEVKNHRHMRSRPD